MSDRELLELAAKAYADPQITPGSPHFSRWIGRNEDMGCDVSVIWNPLTDDGDALRLAVKLELIPYPPTKEYPQAVCQNNDSTIDICVPVGVDPCAAMRRAIVQAAAEVGKGMLTYDEFVLMFPGRFEAEEVERAAAEIGRSA